MDLDFDKKIDSIVVLNEEVEMTKSFSIDQRYIIVDFKILNSKFSIQKKFFNTYDGKKELDDFQNTVETKDKFKKYLGV